MMMGISPNNIREIYTYAFNLILQELQTIKPPMVCRECAHALSSLEVTAYHAYNIIKLQPLRKPERSGITSLFFLWLIREKKKFSERKERTNKRF